MQGVIKFAAERNHDASVLLVGIDDTDNLTSPGTGYHARQLGERLVAKGVARVCDITRHQLLFDRRIPYTSHNSSLCLRVEVAPDVVPSLIALCRDYLLTKSAPGSDAGLCVAPWAAVPPEVEAFGSRAKREILTRDAAVELSMRTDIYLEGLTGDHGGMIGALAAVGLRRGGNDGRIAWLPGVRETTGIVTADYLLRHTGIDAIRRYDDDRPIDLSDRIEVSPWPRAVLIASRAVLLIEKGNPDHGFDWKLVSKDILRQY